MVTRVYQDYHGHTMQGSESLLPGEFALRYAEAVARAPGVTTTPNDLDDLSDDILGRIDQLRRFGLARAMLADIVVSNSGGGTYPTIQAGLQAAARFYQRRAGKYTGDVVVYVAPGYYDEAPMIPSTMTGDIVIVSTGRVTDAAELAGDASATFWAGGAIISGIFTIGAAVNVAVAGIQFVQGIDSTTSLSSNVLRLEHCWLLRTDGAQVINDGAGGAAPYTILDHCYVSSTADLLDSITTLIARNCTLDIRSFHATATTGAILSLYNVLLLGGAAGVAMYRHTSFATLHALRVEFSAAGGFVSSAGAALSLARVSIMNSRFFLAATQTAITLGASQAVIVGNRILGNLTTARGTGITFASAIANSNAIVQGNQFQGLVTGLDGGSALNTTAYASVIGPNAYSSNTTNYTGVAAAIDYQIPSGAFAHNLLAATHSDSVAQTVSRGSLIYGNTTPAWDELVIGAAGSILRSDGTDFAWTINPTITGYGRFGSASAPTNTTAGDLTAIRLFINDDTNFAFSVVSLNPRFALDSGDYWEYNRANNSLDLILGALASPATCRITMDARATANATAVIYFYTQETGTSAYAGPNWFRQGATDTRLKWGIETDTGAGSVQDPSLTVFRHTGVTGAEVRDPVMSWINSTGRTAIYLGYQLSFRSTDQTIASTTAGQLDIDAVTLIELGAPTVSMTAAATVADALTVGPSDFGALSHLVIQPLSGTNRVGITSGTGRGAIFVGASGVTEAVSILHASGFVGILNSAPDVEFQVTGTAWASGNIRAGTYAQVGSLALPTNTTTGDLTATRLMVGTQVALGSGGATANLALFAATMTDTASGATALVTYQPSFAPASNSAAEFRTFNLLGIVPATTDVDFSVIIHGLYVEGARPRGSGNFTRTATPGIDGITAIGSNFDSSTDDVGTISFAAGVVAYGARRVSGTFNTKVVTRAAALFCPNPDAISGSAYITTYYGLDIDSLTRATTNIGIRNASTLRQVGQAVLGVDAAPTANVVADFQQQTLGNEVIRIASVATNDDPTESLYQGRAATTDATVTTLFTYTIPASTTVLIQANVVARRTGGTLGTAEDGAGYVIDATIKNVAGVATLIGAVLPDVTQEDQVLWDATIDVTGATARVRVTGAASNNVVWHATIRVWQVGS